MKKSFLLTFLMLFTFGCSDDSLNIQEQSPQSLLEDLTQTEGFNEDRNLYFGDTHVHTKYSFDAFIFGTTATPDDAYTFAKGGSIKHPLGFDMQLGDPLDFFFLEYFVLSLKTFALLNLPACFATGFILGRFSFLTIKAKYYC